MGLEPDYFEQTSSLLETGYSVRGGIVQANNDLYQPEYVHGRLAEVIYDTTGRLTPSDLLYYANFLFKLKTEPNNLNPVQKYISDYLRAENKRLFNYDISDVIGYPLKISSLFVDQNHLPDGMLTINNLMIVINPSKTQFAMILPYHFWSERFKSLWFEYSYKHHGKYYQIDDLRKAKEQLEIIRYLKQQSLSEAATANNHSNKQQIKKPESKEPFNWTKFILGWTFWIIILIIILKITF